MIVEIAFYAFLLLTALSALGIVLTKNVLYAALMLLMTFLGVSGVYVFAGADFLAIAQIVIYVGGVLILLIFAIMFANRSTNNTGLAFGNNVQNAPISKSHNNFLGGVLALTLFFAMSYAIFFEGFSGQTWIQNAIQEQNFIQESTIEQMGILLMTNYLLPFELIAILLLVALVGSTLISKIQMDKEN